MRALAPRVVSSRSELDATRDELTGRTVALVPTMGALHDGHRALMARARELADAVVVSIFVNPLQFGPGEDLERYPRPFSADLEVCADEQVSVVWAPDVATMYPTGAPLVSVSAGPLGDVLEGAVRPGHFDGVLTVVAKLVGQVRPDVLVMGRKDAQQLVLIKRMVADLDLPVRVEGVATVRDPDGVAVSSRNVYLTEHDRVVARSLGRAIRAASVAAPAGPEAVRAAARDVLTSEPGFDVDYLELVDPETLAPAAPDARGELVLLVAGRVGSTHLVDNVTVVC
jgi:pantoate--beta-alanine ligase